MRWIEFGAVSGAMRTKATGQAIPNYERPQVWEPEILPHWRRGLEDQYMFGPDLLTAPVLRPGARTRELYLPEGRWIDFWRAVAYDDHKGGFDLRALRPVRSGRRVTVPAPLEELPMFARAGSLFALLPPEVDTLASYGSERGLVHLSDRRRKMRLLLFPRGRTSRSFGYGERLSSSEKPGRWHLAVRGVRTRTYTMQASLRTLRSSLRPCSVKLNGKRLSRDAWSFDAQSRVLNASFRAHRAQLVVDGC